MDSNGEIFMYLVTIPCAMRWWLKKGRGCIIISGWLLVGSSSFQFSSNMVR